MNEQTRNTSTNERQHDQNETPTRPKRNANTTLAKRETRGIVFTLKSFCMKKLMIVIAFIGVFTLNLLAQETGVLPETAAAQGWDIFKNYGAELLLALMALAKIVVSITPTIKDDQIFAKLDKLIEWLLPNFIKK